MNKISCRNHFWGGFVLFLLISVNQVIASFPEEYNQAVKQFQSAKTRQDYELTAATFIHLAHRPDAGMLKANCIYWEGECWFALKDYLRALMTFERVLLIPKSNKEEDARYKVALCYARLNWVQTARWEFSRFMRDFPSSRHIKSIKIELDKLSKEINK